MSSAFLPPPSAAPSATAASPNATLQTTFTISGELGDFDENAFRTALLSAFPAATDVLVTAVAGSVVVRATFIFALSASAHAAATTIRQTSPSDMQDEWFGGTVTIEAVSEPTVHAAAATLEGETVDPSSASQQTSGSAGGDSSLTIIGASVAGAVVVLLLLVGCAVRMKRRGGGRAQTGHAFRTPGRKQPKPRPGMGGIGGGNGFGGPNDGKGNGLKSVKGKVQKLARLEWAKGRATTCRVASRRRPTRTRTGLRTADSARSPVDLEAGQPHLRSARRLPEGGEEEAAAVGAAAAVAAAVQSVRVSGGVVMI